MKTELTLISETQEFSAELHLAKKNKSMRTQRPRLTSNHEFRLAHEPAY
jgi:hypothetical protein